MIISDVTVVPELLTGKKEAVYGDSGYLVAENRENAVTKINRAKIKYKINHRPSQSKTDPTNQKHKLESVFVSYCVRILVHNFAEDKAKIRRHTVVFQGFPMQSLVKFAEKMGARVKASRSAKADCETEYDVHTGEPDFRCQTFSVGGLIWCAISEIFEDRYADILVV